jgi:hypothetical protein
MKGLKRNGFMRIFRRGFSASSGFLAANSMLSG